MRSYNIEKTEKITRTKAIFVALFIHFCLLFGLFYMNRTPTEQMMPDFVKKWVGGDSNKEAVASKGKMP